jgi:hypothetical protein
MKKRRDADREKRDIVEDLGEAAEAVGDVIGDVARATLDAADAVEDRLEGALRRVRHRPEAIGGPGKGGGRPGKTVGTSRGAIDGTPITKRDLRAKHAPNSWAGERKDLVLPMLFLRANPGDNGTRPVVGPFWESPDIFILAGVAPGDAPDIPPTLGQTALANAPNTVYAQVWNFGRAAAHEVFVEFWWIDPSLGISPQGVHQIGQTVTSLGARGSGHAHAVVKCPEPWPATFVNGGHECLLVRAWTLSDDVLGSPAWDASLNRHVAQRNIHVIGAADLAAAPPLQLKVGPLYGAAAQVAVTRAKPTDVPWLQLHTGTRGLFPMPAPETGQPLLTPPAGLGAAPPIAPGATRHAVNGDDQQVGFSTSDDPPGAGQAHVYRVTADQGGQVVGGYTVVVMG